MTEEDVAADEAVSAVIEEVEEEDAVASVATEEDEAVDSVVVEVDEVDSVTEVVVVADAVLLEAVDEVLLEAEPEAVLVVAKLEVLEVDPTSSLSHTDTPVSLLLRAKKCFSSPKTLHLASLSMVKSASRSRHQELVLTAPAPRPSTESGTLSDQSLQLVFSAVWT